MQWLELKVKVHPDAVESVSELMSRYSREGVVIEQPIDLIDDGLEYRVREGEPLIVHAYIPMDGTEEEAIQRVNEGLWHFSSIGSHFVGTLETLPVNNEDWENEWKKYFHVTRIGKRIIIRPSWRDYTPRAGEVVITLDPGMAFGNGLHATTNMCLELIEQHVRPDMRVLDVGTGSGILALAAMKLGAGRVYAIDNDSVAVESASENAAVNGLSDHVQVVHGTLDETTAQRLTGQYDLVLANIIAQVIGSIAPQLAQALAPGGLLITSGIIEKHRQKAEIPLLEAGLELVEQRQIDDWLALVFKKG